MEQETKGTGKFTDLNTNGTIRNDQEVHSEGIADIIGTPPSALIRWGITWVFTVIVAIVVLSSYIRYPDVIRAPLRINAANAPKAVITKLSGNIVNILVKDNDTVSAGQSLVWMESTANHEQVLTLLEQLRVMHYSISQKIEGIYTIPNAPERMRLGEVQVGYQTFYQSYLAYRAAVGQGIHLKRRAYILEELQNVERQRILLERQKKLQEQELTLAEMDFDRYRELADRNVISPSEYQQQQSVLLAKKYPLEQTESSLLANASLHTEKRRELTNLDNQIAEEKLKFIQALNSFISEVEQWKAKYILFSPQKGTVEYAGIFQPGQHVDVGQEILYINPGSTDFFGEVNIPQYNMGKVTANQEVLVKLDSYPFEQYGVMRGRVDRMNHVPYRDSVFLSRVIFTPIEANEKIRLTTGMIGTAEIITEDATLLQRLLRNIRLLMNQRN